MDRRRDLEWHFNPRLSVSAFEECFADRRARSQQVLRSHPVLHRETYGQHSRAYYLAAPLPDKPRAPAMIYIHGGYWRSGVAEDNALLIPRLHELGIVPILLGYPLCPESKLPDVVAHVRLAIDHIRANNRKLGIDESRLLIAGTSAGAHLAAMVLALDDKRLFQAAMLFSGIYDLTPVPLLGVNDEIGVRPRDVRPMSPALQMPARNVRMSLAIGADEPALWQAQTFAFENLYRAGGCSTSLHVAPGRHHFNLYEELLIPSSPIAIDLTQMVNELR
ncbi:MAG: alpha/beta hydrolase [Burkholderiales bacterium]|nr:alpha/beta hydrolase [Burkholderiales bacterium]